jgi:acid phosphatase family membrane protein YuiD
MAHYDFWTIAWNRPLIGALGSMAGAQILKFFVALLRGDRKPLLRLFDYGGMPSGHTALICAAAAGAGFAAGFDSALFAVAAACAAIFVYDILKLRRVVDLQGAELEALREKAGLPPPAKMPQFRSHSPAEIVAGGLWGLACALIAAAA